MQNTTPHSIAVFQPSDSALYYAFPSFSYFGHQCTVEAAKATNRRTEKYRNCHSSRDSAENKRKNYRKNYFEEFTLVGLSSLYFLFEIKVSFNWYIIYFVHEACKDHTQTQLLERLHLYSQQVHCFLQILHSYIASNSILGFAVNKRREDLLVLPVFKQLKLFFYFLNGIDS